MPLKLCTCRAWSPVTAEFYFARLLPRADGHYSAALAPTSAVMQMPQELFQMA
jgi:hypothetical protein